MAHSNDHFLPKRANGKSLFGSQSVKKNTYPQCIILPLDSEHTVDDYESIPPLMAAYLQRDVPLVSAGTHLDIRNFKAELMRHESIDGWQYVEGTMGIMHVVHTMTSRSLLFATPVKFTQKVPPFLRRPVTHVLKKWKSPPKPKKMMVFFNPCIAQKNLGF